MDRAKHRSFTFTQFLDAVDYLKTSLASLQRYHRGLDSGFALKVEIRSRQAAGQPLQLQLWWMSVYSRGHNELLWDFCELKESAETHEVTLARALDRQGLRYNPRGVAAPAISLAAPGPAFGFHPLRFRTYHPLALSASRLQELAEHSASPAESLKTAKSAVDALLRRRTSPLRDQAKDLDPHQVAVHMVRLALVYGEFHRRGRIIFTVPQDVVNRCRQTDLRRTSFGSLYLPERAFYLHLGLQRELSWQPGWCVDGVYVARSTPDGWDFAITCAPPSPKIYFRAIRGLEPVLTGRWGPEEKTIALSQAIEKLAAEQFSKANEQLLVSAQVKRGARVNDTLKERTREQLAALACQRAVLIKTLQLLLPVLLYLSGYEESSEQLSIAQTLGYVIQPPSDEPSRARAMTRAQQLKLRLPAAHRRGDLPSRQSSRAPRLSPVSRRK